MNIETKRGYEYGKRNYGQSAVNDAEILRCIEFEQDLDQYTDFDRGIGLAIAEHENVAKEMLKETRIRKETRIALSKVKTAIFVTLDTTYEEITNMIDGPSMDGVVDSLHRADTAIDLVIARLDGATDKNCDDC